MENMSKNVFHVICFLAFDSIRCGMSEEISFSSLKMFRPGSRKLCKPMRMSVRLQWLCLF